MGRLRRWFIVNCGDEMVNVTSDASHPNVLYIDEHADTVLVQISRTHYEVRKGRWHVGDVQFYNGDVVFGWRFLPRTSRFQASRRLHRNPEAALAGRGLAIKGVFSKVSPGKTA